MPKKAGARHWNKLDYLISHNRVCNRCSKWCLNPLPTVFFGKIYPIFRHWSALVLTSHRPIQRSIRSPLTIYFRGSQKNIVLLSLISTKKKVSVLLLRLGLTCVLQHCSTTLIDTFRLADACKIAVTFRMADIWRMVNIFLTGWYIL